MVMYDVISPQIFALLNAFPWEYRIMLTKKKITFSYQNDKSMKSHNSFILKDSHLLNVDV